MCAASSPERLSELKRATVSAHWELVGGALSLGELAEQIELHVPDVVVLDASIGSEAVERLRTVPGSLRVVSLGELSGADAVAQSVEGIRDAILGVPAPGGPVST